jgi:hypothetical protein
VGQKLEVVEEEEIEKRASKTKWKKPKGIKVIALIFCKRLHNYFALGHARLTHLEKLVGHM